MEDRRSHKYYIETASTIDRTFKNTHKLSVTILSVKFCCCQMCNHVQCSDILKFNI